jgi:hypothetical protein
MRTTVELEISDNTRRQAFELLERFNKDNNRPMNLQEYLEFVLRTEIEARHKVTRAAGNDGGAWW